MAAVIFIALCIMWIFRNSRCLCNRRSMLRRLNSIRLPNPTDGTTITLNDTCVHSSTSLPMKRERSKYPAALSCTVSVNSQHTQSVVADMSCARTLQRHPGHPFPQHCVLDNARSGVDHIITDDPRNITLKSSVVSYQCVDTRMLLRTMLPDAMSQTVGKTEELPVMPLGKRVPSSLKTCKLEVNHDTLTACCTGDPRIKLDSEGSDSGTFIMEGTSDSISMDALPTSLDHSSDATTSSSTVCELMVPKLSSIPMSFEHGQPVNITKAQVTTPPHTPPTVPAFSLTTPSPQYNLHLTLNKHHTEDIKTWSDVLSVAEYEREEHLIHARKVTFQNHLPSPPSTPTMSSFAHRSAQSLSSNTAIQEAQLLSAGSTSYLPLERGLFIDAQSTADQHQCNGDDYSFTHVQEADGTSRCGLPINLEVGDEDNNSNDELPPYQSFGFDYEKRLAIKRATSLLANPVRPEASSNRNVLRQAASTVRPRPPVAEYKPLLLRPVDRSRIKPRTGLLGLDVPPFAGIKKKTFPMTTRQRSRTTGELSPHVHVLEQLIEHVSERRTGDIALGTI